MKYLVDYPDPSFEYATEALIDCDTLMFMPRTRQHPQIQFVMQTKFNKEPVIMITVDKPFSICKYDKDYYVLKENMKTVPGEAEEVDIVQKHIRYLRTQEIQPLLIK